MEGQSIERTDLDYILQGISRPYEDDFENFELVNYYTRHISSGTSLRLNECTAVLKRLIDKKDLEPNVIATRGVSRLIQAMPDLLGRCSGLGQACTATAKGSSGCLFIAQIPSCILRS